MEILKLETTGTKPISELTRRCQRCERLRLIEDFPLPRSIYCTLCQKKRIAEGSAKRAALKRKKYGISNREEVNQKRRELYREQRNDPSFILLKLKRRRIAERYRKKHSERIKKNALACYYRNRERFLADKRVRDNRECDELHDNYVMRLLVRQTGIPAEDLRKLSNINLLLEAKRQIIISRRRLKCDRK